MPRGRPKNKVDHPDAGGGEPSPHAASPPPALEADNPEVAAILELDIPGIPPAKVKGAWNPEYFAALLQFANNRYVKTTLIDGETSNFNYAQFQKGVLDAAKLVGITERDIIDRRTKEQRAEDVWKMICSDPESPFGVSDEDLRALDAVIEAKEKRMNEADEQCRDRLLAVLNEEEEAKAERELVGAAGRRAIAENRTPKAWRRRIQRILRLKQRAKMPIPPCIEGSWGGNQYTERENPGLVKYALEAAQPLRFMIFVGRSGMDQAEQFAKKSKENPADLIFDIGPHHVRFCVSLWMHRKGVAIRWDKERQKYVLVPGVVQYQGSVQVMAIGHGKTELAIHYVGLEMGLNPRTQGLYLHAKSDVAIQNLAAIKRFLNAEDGIGKRYLGLFPCKVTKYQNDSRRIRLDIKNPPKSPTMTATGTDSASLGIDADFQVWDDVVPQSDAEQPTERERRSRLLRGTFSSRKRSRSAFTLVIGTLWHHNDALMKMIEDAKRANETQGREGLVYGVCVQRCGGPNANAHTKAWQSLWPKMYDAERLRKKYAELGPSLYSAAMMANPLADEQRIVKKLRVYDPATEEHQAFQRSCVKYISLDPSATKNSDSDKAGIVYAGFGDWRVSRQDEHGPVSDTEKRVRILDFHEIHATQSDLTEYVLNFARMRPVDYVMAEAVGGFIGIIEMFQNLEIDAIRKDPRGKNKESRLRAVAPILEDANAAQGFRAVCEFPGVRNEAGELVLDPRFKSLQEQILDFGVCAHDHALDALTYLLGDLSPDLGIGRGIVTEHVKKVEKELGDPRLLAMYKAYERAEKQAKSGISEDLESEWMRANWR